MNMWNEIQKLEGKTLQTLYQKKKIDIIEITENSGAVLELETPAGEAKVVSRLAGEVNILNLLAAFTAAHARGVAFADLVEFVPRLQPVPGRFQSVDAGQPFTVIVDYAHTDDALLNLRRWPVR